MIKTKHRDRWSYWTAKDLVGNILRLALSSGDTGISGKALEIIHLTGERQDRSFEPLLKEFEARSEGGRVAEERA